MTERIAATAEEAAKIAELMKAPYPITLGSVAKALACDELTAAKKLPEDIASFVKTEKEDWFDGLWAALADWEKVTLFIIHDGHVFEIAGKLHAGKRMHGYYNILAKSAQIGGHIRYEGIKEAAFLEMPFMGRQSLSVAFFNEKGEVSFSVYAGRENHQIIESVKAAFAADKARFCA